MLAEQPTREARYDQATDHWTVDFDAGYGLVVYVLNDQPRRVVILRTFVYRLSQEPGTAASSGDGLNTG